MPATSWAISSKLASHHVGHRSDRSVPSAQQVTPWPHQKWMNGGRDAAALCLSEPIWFSFPEQPAMLQLLLCRGVGSGSVCCPQELVLNTTAGTPWLSTTAADGSQQSGFTPVKLQSCETQRCRALKSWALNYLQAPESPNSKTHRGFSPKLWKVLKVKRIITRGFNQ